jgi:hypothetical protein
MPHGNTTRPLGPFLLIALLSWALGGCGAEPVPVTLGPTDGQDLPPTEIERVAVGSLAPDFSLETVRGDTLTLSAFQGEKNVVLVFYRGHW